jgi:serine protease Do
MKTRSKLTELLIIAAIAASAAPAIDAQEKISYEDLSKSVTIDKVPLKRETSHVASYADALENVMPSVVTIFSTKEVERNAARNPMFNDPMFRRFFGIPEGEELPDNLKPENQPKEKEQGLGSGVIITSDGYILTNNHVVGDADEIMVALANGKKKEYKATLIGSDPQTDVALIKIDEKDLKHIVVGDSSQLRVGDVTLAVGNPFGLEQTVTSGIVSALGRNSLNITGGGYENFIQTDASINRGNSGGALIDAEGRLIGINTAIQSGVTGGNIGIGFAIPVNMALSIVKNLLDNDGTVKRGFLGVFLKDLDPDMAKALGRDDQSGVLVSEVGPGTPAEKAGVKPLDIITAYNGTPAENMARLRLDISNNAPGTDVKFDIIRGGKPQSLTVKLGDLADAKMAGGQGGRPEREGKGADKPREFIKGVQITDLNDELRTTLQLPEDVKGVAIRSVAADSVAAEKGLQIGQIITMVNQKPVDSVQAANAARKELEGDVLILQVYIEGRKDVIAIPVKE